MGQVVELDSTKRTVADIVKDVNDSAQQIEMMAVVFKINGVYYISAAGQWHDVCAAAVIMNDHAAHYGEKRG